MFFKSFLLTTSLLGLILAFSQGAQPEIDGYHGHMFRGCTPDNFLGEIVAQGIDECKQLCDSFTQCEGFEIAGYNSGAYNCWPKSNCSGLRYHGFWHVYVRNPGHGGCTFEEYPGKALYLSNDANFADANPESCKKRCLLDIKCLSFNLNRETDTCSLSYSSKDSKPELYEDHQNMTYYHKTCGPQVEHVPDDIIAAPDLSRIVIKDGQCTKVAGPYGVTVGTYFSDEQIAVHNITAIKTVCMYGAYLQRIGLKYGRRRFALHGSKGKRPEVAKVILKSDEYITKVEGLYDIRIDQITFITNQRSIGPFGQHLSYTIKTFSADGRGKPLLYISGSADFAVAHLNFHFMC